MRLYSSLGFMLFLGACASLTQEQCQNGDWRGIGYSDGVNGRLESYISRHFDACSEAGIVPDTAAWMAGRTQGLTLYCTPQNAYSIGRAGREINPVCPASQASALFQSWDWGQEYYLIGQDILRLENEQREIERQILLEYNQPTLTPAQLVTLSSLNRRLRAIDREIYRLENRQRRYATAPI